MLQEVELLANDIRSEIVTAMNSKGGGHIGGSLSISDLVAVLYGGVMNVDANNPDWNKRDYLVCSKGHCAPAIYAALALKGFFSREWLLDLNKPGTKLPGHSDRKKVPGIDATTGSLGQGMSIACGLAHSIKMDGSNQYVYCITGDGENDEGQIWEAAMYAANYELDHLVVFLDWNKKQIDGTNDMVMKLFNLEEKYRAFGWYCQKINGNNVDEIVAAVSNIKRGKSGGKPSFVLLDTVKGAGIPCIEAIENNHCIGISNQLAEQCQRELLEARDKIMRSV